MAGKKNKSGAKLKRYEVVVKNRTFKIVQGTMLERKNLENGIFAKPAA